MKKNILYDARWNKNDGIGRYLNEVISRIQVEKYGDKYNPISVGGIFVSGRRINRTKPEIYYTPGFNLPFGLKKKYI